MEGTQMEIQHLRQVPGLAIRVSSAVGDFTPMRDGLMRIARYAHDRTDQAPGPMFLRYLSADGGRLTVEVGLFYEEPIEGDGDIRAVTLPEGPAVAVTHKGPFNTILDVHKEVARFANKLGRRPRCPAFEVYLSDGEQTLSSPDLETLVMLPLVDDLD